MFASIPPAQRAFIAGATGYTGRHVVQCLRKLRIDTHAHVRPDSSALTKWKQEFESQGATIDTTPWEFEPMLETLQRIQPTVVFALLGTTKARAKVAAKSGRRIEEESYERIDYGLTALLLRAVQTSEADPRFVYLSSIGVGTSPAHSAYLEARQRLESELVTSGVSFTIARASFITGSDRDEARPGERAAAALTNTLLKVAGALGAHELKARYASATGDALAQNLVMLALDPAAENTIVEGSALRRFA